MHLDSTLTMQEFWLQEDYDCSVGDGSTAVISVTDMQAGRGKQSSVSHNFTSDTIGIILHHDGWILPCLICPPGGMDPDQV